MSKTVEEVVAQELAAWMPDAFGGLRSFYGQKSIADWPQDWSDREQTNFRFVARELIRHMEQLGYILPNHDEPSALSHAESLLRSAYERAEKAEAALRAQLEWKPIETAPKDGTHVQLFTSREGIGMGFFAPWRGVSGRWLACFGTEEYLNPGTIDEEPLEVEPTHWRELPPPPKTDVTPTTQDDKRPTTGEQA